MIKDKEHKQDKVKVHILSGCLLLAAGFALLFAARVFPAFAEWYSPHLYQIWVNVLGRVMGIFPFSVSEISLYILVLLILITGGRLIYCLIKKKAGKKEGAAWAAKVFLLAAVLFFLYVINCGINYNRKSFSEISGFTAEAYSAAQLKEVCERLTLEVNERAGQVKRNQNGVMNLTGSSQDKAVAAMHNLGADYPQLAGYYPQPKAFVLSEILSVQQLSGIYLPFTIEANYNGDMPDYIIPFTVCHELSHLRGFMQEEEANFIAFLASSQSGDMEFQYSGYLMGWTYCMNALYREDYDAWEEIRAGLSETVEADLKADREFWSRYDGAVAEVANQINDTYLKANGQENGVRSYGKMIDLMIAYYN